MCQFRINSMYVSDLQFNYIHKQIIHPKFLLNLEQTCTLIVYTFSQIIYMVIYVLEINKIQLFGITSGTVIWYLMDSIKINIYNTSIILVLFTHLGTYMFHLLITNDIMIMHFFCCMQYSLYIPYFFRSVYQKQSTFRSTSKLLPLVLFCCKFR